MREQTKSGTPATSWLGQQGRIFVPGLMALFLGGFVSHVVPFSLYMLVASGLQHAPVALKGLYVFWPVFLGMAGVAALQSALWMRIPPTRPQLLASCFGRGFLVEAPVLVALLMVPGWLLLAPFFLFGGVAACLVAAILIVRNREILVPEPGRSGT